MVVMVAVLMVAFGGGSGGRGAHLSSGVVAETEDGTGSGQQKTMLQACRNLHHYPLRGRQVYKQRLPNIDNGPNVCLYEARAQAKQPIVRHKMVAGGV
jgi:hypothetical protein